MTGLLDPPMKAASAIAAGRIMNLLLKFLGREKKIYMYICTQREREVCMETAQQPGRHQDT